MGQKRKNCSRAVILVEDQLWRPQAVDIHNECPGHSGSQTPKQDKKSRNKTATLCFSSYVYLPFNFPYSSPPIVALGVVPSIGEAKVGITSGQNCSRTGNCLLPFCSAKCLECAPCLAFICWCERSTGRQKLLSLSFHGSLYLNLVSLDLVNSCEFTHFRHSCVQLKSQNTPYFKHVKGELLFISLQRLVDARKIDFMTD